MKRKTLNKKLRAVFVKHATANGFKVFHQMDNVLKRRKSTGTTTNRELLSAVMNALEATL